MDKNFWHQKWERGEIGFHANDVNPMLVEHLGKLNLAKEARLFLPLCGKTLDIGWLLAQGYRIVGSELNSLAIRALFADLALIPEITSTGTLTCYRAPNIDIWGGDIFALSSRMIEPIDAIYDRAALVALPEEIRKRYTTQLMKLTHNAPQLLITLEYNQHLYDGPPFSVCEKELKLLYGSNYHLNFIAQEEIPGGFKEKVEAKNVTWVLQKIKSPAL